MAFTCSVLLLLSLASHSLSMPLVPAIEARLSTFYNGLYHPSVITFVAQPSFSFAPVIPSASAIVFAPEQTTTSAPSPTKFSSSSLLIISKASPSLTVSPETSAATSGGVLLSTSASYVHFKGDGTAAQGWPTIDRFVSFDTMWALNKPIMAVSCGEVIGDNTEAEMATLQSAILAEAQASQIDSRLILATIMQESTGCIRVHTTISPDGTVRNPGIMQDHDGAASCAGTSIPCPDATIKTMVKEGTAGTTSGDGLMQTFQEAGASPVSARDATAFYIAARIYNSGLYTSGPLESGAATPCYASDIANRLVGFADTGSPCIAGTV